MSDNLLARLKVMPKTKSDAQLWEMKKDNLMYCGLSQTCK